MNACWICDTTDNLFELPCEHYVCTMCLKEYIVNELQNEKIKVECPLMKCSTIIPDNIINYILSIKND
jgi:hypothetical protein